MLESTAIMPSLMWAIETNCFSYKGASGSKYSLILFMICTSQGPSLKSIASLEFAFEFLSVEWSTCVLYDVDPCYHGGLTIHQQRLLSRSSINAFLLLNVTRSKALLSSTS